MSGELPARFIAKCAVNRETGCWDWLGAQDGHGYGTNPSHMEPVTNQENTRRGYDTGYCRNGHLRTAANTYRRPDERIECRDCRAEREAA